MESDSPFSPGDADSAFSSTGLSSLCVRLSRLSTRFASIEFFCLFASRGGCVWVGNREGALVWGAGRERAGRERAGRAGGGAGGRGA